MVAGWQGYYVLFVARLQYWLVRIITFIIPHPVFELGCYLFKQSFALIEFVGLIIIAKHLSIVGCISCKQVK